MILIFGMDEPQERPDRAEVKGLAFYSERIAF